MLPKVLFYILVIPFIKERVYFEVQILLIRMTKESLAFRNIAFLFFQNLNILFLPSIFTRKIKVSYLSMLFFKSNVGFLFRKHGYQKMVMRQQDLRIIFKIYEVIQI